ncbi:PCNA-interacting partner isoform X1 [Danio rerio]|uniref:PCNA-interacting partner n=1 Tax=Danio rerio TaxID=7955 RepID=J9JI04_DANRE|nr:PCNA-interacting partner [Danio rerio]XP_017210590.1 PCNA-interacting partner isoform X1 [Danio rerio]|eukprot:NP_001035470.2 PCNA-interacting partner [Danio rerio]
MLVVMEERMRTMARVFRRECHRVLDSERTTIQGADGMLMVLQLAIAGVNKQERGDFGVALSEVLAVWKYFLLDKLQLSHKDIPLPQSYDLIRKEYDCFLKRTNTVDLIDVFSMFKELRLNEDPEEPLTTMQMFQFLFGENESSEKPSQPVCPATPSCKAADCSPQIQRVVRRVFCSYLGLLVNSKNDLALTYTLDNPNRSLGHIAFTDLRHAACDSASSLFLTVTSFVRAIQLGGKGYAPPESHPLRKHVKGLSEFLNFVDQCQDILGETPNPREAGCKLVSSIRAALVKGRSAGDPVYLAAEESTKSLKERIGQIHAMHTQSTVGTGISPARPKAYAINHATAYGGRETVKVLMALLDEEALALPCRNKAELLSEDHAAINGSTGACLLALYKSPEAPTGSSPKSLRNRVLSQQEHIKSKVVRPTIRSQFACTYKEEELPLNRVLEFPSTSQIPTCVHPAPKKASSESDNGMDNRFKEATNLRCEGPGQSALGEHSGNAWNQTGGKSTQPEPLRRATGTLKRKLANRECTEQGREENQPPQKRPPAKAATGGPGKRNNKAVSKKLIAGQGKLTGFFRL